MRLAIICMDVALAPDRAPPLADDETCELIHEPPSGSYGKRFGDDWYQRMAGATHTAGSLQDLKRTGESWLFFKPAAIKQRDVDGKYKQKFDA